MPLGKQLPPVALIPAETQVGGWSRRCLTKRRGQAPRAPVAALAATREEAQESRPTRQGETRQSEGCARRFAVSNSPMALRIFAWHWATSTCSLLPVLAPDERAPQAATPPSTLARPVADSCRSAEKGSACAHRKQTHDLHWKLRRSIPTALAETSE